MTPVDAGLRAAGFTVIATLARPIGGNFGDKIGAERILTIVYAGIAIGALVIAFSMENIIIMTASCLFIAILAGLGNGAVFKLVPQLFPHETGAVTGIVGAWGGPMIRFMQLEGRFAMGKKMCRVVIFLSLGVNIILLQWTVEAYYSLEYKWVHVFTLIACLSVMITLAAFFKWRKLEYKERK